MVDSPTERVAQYVSEKGIKVSALSRGTGIPDGILRRSLCRKERDLRAGEFLKICVFLEKEPLEFAVTDEKIGSA